MRNNFDITGKVVLITGGSGLMGRAHAEAVAEFGAIPVIGDIDLEFAVEILEDIHDKTGVKGDFVELDVTSTDSITGALQKLTSMYKRIDVLINNAALNPTVSNKSDKSTEWSRFEDFSVDTWNKDLEVGLTGAFLCSQIVGNHMKENKNGVIINIASDLALIAPDQRIYRIEGLSEDMQPVKPISYSVVKAGLVALTKYLSVYWADQGIRVNALCPGGIYDNQDIEFVNKLSNLIPMGRMAEPSEYKSAVVFLCSEASRYMTGSCLTIDGGRTVW
ncbi:MAG: NAD(P)-dependent dehydrogenase, short-chain alcohol dehydrogenase family [Chloroflexi bacterium]|nr:MAG: NAD(P)-dependent dehydrogenase, short-chain alcohol dehydrogenase family [Chloroflexota bacterium]